LSGTQKQIKTLEAQVAELSDRLAAVEAAVDGGAGVEGDLAAAPARSLRRARARRASKRRAQARALRPDTKVLVIEYLEKHPGSTAGALAKGIDVNRSTVSSSLAQLVRLGRIHKDERGYVVD
jgi:DNA-binding transcriptional ArsR family regulator